MNDNSSNESERSFQGTLPTKEWKVLLEDIETRHWRESIEKLDCPVITQKRSWFIDPAKALFYKNLHLPSKDCFLDIGAGSGVISTELSNSFKNGVAFDLLPDAVRFMKKRVLQDKISNVHVVAGDGLKLPFCNEVFDLIILHGVLEWIASFDRGKNCRKVQRDFLINNLRCLKKGGKIAIAIENRWDLKHFVGKSPHNEPPFVAVLPRLLARAIHFIVHKKDYRTYVYSYFGYKRLLEDAGFKDVKIYLGIPNYYNPKHIGEMTKEVFEQHFDGNKVQTRSLRKKTKKNLYSLLLSMGLLKYFWTAFFIEACKK